MAEASRARFFAGLLVPFDLGLPSFISECGFGGIRKRAPISRLAPSTPFVLSMVITSFVLGRGLPDHRRTAEYLGHLNVAWASVEYCMFGLLSILCNTPLPLARGLFYSQRTTRARIDLILAVHRSY